MSLLEVHVSQAAEDATRLPAWRRWLADIADLRKICLPRAERR